MLIDNLMIRAVPVGICKHLFGQRTASSARKPLTRVLKPEVKPQRPLSPEIVEGTSILKKYPQPSPIPWEKVSDTLAQKNEDVHNVIIKSCMQLQDADTLMSYYAHVKNKGENFSEINLFFIIKTLSGCPPAKILQYEHLVTDLYEKSKEFLLVSQLLQTPGVEVFSYIPYCYRELVQMVLRNSSLPKKEYVTARAFDFDDLPVAWELVERLDRNLTEVVLEAFVNYCIRQVIGNKFSVDHLQRLVTICQSRGLIIEAADIICALQPLVSLLSVCDKEYVWSVRKSIVNPEMDCLNCHTRLKEVEMSNEEFQSLRQAVFRALLPEDVFLKSTSAELHRFKKFLSTCQPFDFVIDGLNFLYRGIAQGKQQKFLPLMLEKFVVERKKKVLIITKRHVRRSNLSSLSGAQVFFANNSSDDDMFIIWAALHGGLGTGLLTCDFLNTHSSKLDAESRLLFVKWQMYHQYIIDRKFGVVLPRKHLGLSQCTESPGAGGESYKWHLSYQEGPHSLYSFRLNTDWVCLQRTPRKAKEKRGKSSERANT